MSDGHSQEVRRVLGDIHWTLGRIRDHMSNHKEDVHTNWLLSGLRQQGNSELGVYGCLNALDEYDRLKKAGFHSVQAHTLARVAAEVSRSTDLDPYGVGMALRAARAEEEEPRQYTSEDMLKGLDLRELVHVLMKAVDGSSDSDEWASDAQKRLAKSLGDDRASEALMGWVRSVSSSVKKRRKAVRRAQLLAYGAQAFLIFSSVSAAISVMQAFN